MKEKYKKKKCEEEGDKQKKPRGKIERIKERKNEEKENEE